MGHPGRDVMLRMIEDIWWPKIHREVIMVAKTCRQCAESGKNVKSLKRQNEYWKNYAVDRAESGNCD